MAERSGTVVPIPRAVWLRARTARALWLIFFLLPAFLLFVCFVTLPILASLGFSVFRWEGVARREFIGLGNFVRLFTQFPYAERMVNAFRNNVIVLVLTMVIQNGTALILALLLARGVRGARFYRAVFFMPVTLSLVIVGFLWQLFLNPMWGMVNKLLHAAGLGAVARPWLGETGTALYALTLVNAWRWLGFPTIVFLAGINAIPDDFLEAARLDGATEWQVIRHVTLPLLAPALNVIIILTFIGSFNWFELPYVMQGVSGGPFHSTDVLGLLFYRTAFGEVDTGKQDLGIGSAIAVLMFLLVLIVAGASAVLLRRREVEY